MKPYFTAFYALLLAFVPAACSIHGQSATPALLASNDSQNVIRPFDLHGGIASSQMTVQMSDAPPSIAGKQLAHLNLGIREIDITDSIGQTQVVAQYNTPLIVDVLQYQGAAGADVDQTLVNQQTYRQIRFVVDVGASQAIYADNSTGALDFRYGRKDSSDVGAGKTTLTTPAGPGLVAITHKRQFTIGPNATELVNVDFNAFESLAAGSGNGLLVRPSLFVATNWNEGNITGTIVNRSGNPVSNATVVAIGSDGSVGNSAATDAFGNFNLHTLASDTYRLEIHNTYTNAAGANIVSQGASSSGVIFGPTVTVSPGQPTLTGTITD